MLDPLSFIQTIRNSFVGSSRVYTEGSCYQFYLILKEVWPEADAWFDTLHVITKIDDKFYDITGEVELGSHLPMTAYYINSTVKHTFAVVSTLTDQLETPNL